MYLVYYIFHWLGVTPTMPQSFCLKQIPWKNHFKRCKLILTNDWQNHPCLASLLIHNYYLQTYSLFYSLKRPFEKKSWSGWQNKVKQFVHKYVMKILQSNLQHSKSSFTICTATSCGYIWSGCYYWRLAFAVPANKKSQRIAGFLTKVTYFWYNFSWRDYRNSNNLGCFYCGLSPRISSFE